VGPSRQQPNERKNPMTEIPLYDWILNEFGVSARAESVEDHSASLRAVITPGARVIDLCCGGGAFSFFAETLGVEVVGVDISGKILRFAHSEAKDRKSAVRFVKGDILEADLGEGFDVALLLGNTIADFRPTEVRKLAVRVRGLLREGGVLLVGYRDGLRRFIEGTYAREGIQSESPVRITWRFHSYAPDAGAIVEEYERQPSQDTCQYASHVYSPAVVRALLADELQWEEVEPIGENSLLDRFRKKAEAI